MLERCANGAGAGTAGTISDIAGANGRAGGINGRARASRCTRRRASCTNPSLSGVADFSETPRAAVDVSITTALFAFAAATSGSASLEVTSAEVQVELVPATDGL